MYRTREFKVVRLSVTTAHPVKKNYNHHPLDLSPFLFVGGFSNTVQYSEKRTLKRHQMRIRTDVTVTTVQRG